MGKTSRKQTTHELKAIAGMIRDYLIESPNSTQADVGKYFGHSPGWASKYLTIGVDLGMIKVTRWTSPKMYAALDDEGSLYEPAVRTSADHSDGNRRLMPFACSIDQHTYYRLEALKKLFGANYKDEIIGELVDCYMSNLGKEQKSMVDTVANQIKGLAKYIENEKEAFLKNG